MDDKSSESERSLTDSGPTVVNDPPVVEIEKEKVHEKTRSSDTTEATTTGDSASQATSATTGKMTGPLSPNTPGTSVMSRDSVEANGVSSTASRITESEASEEGKDSGGRFNKLRKRSSR